MCQEAIHIEGALLGQHQIHGPAELRGQDRERLGLAMSAGQTPKLFLPFRIAAKEEDRGLGCIDRFSRPPKSASVRQVAPSCVVVNMRVIVPLLYLADSIRKS